MAKIEFNYTDQEETVRKNWLIATAFCSFALPVIRAILMIILHRFGRLSREAYADALAEEILSFAFNIIGFFLIWHCAYRKQGTALLKFSIAMTWGGVIIGGALGLYRGIRYPLVPSSEMIGLLITLGPCCWWLYWATKLKEVNIKNQMILGYKPKEYTDLLESMKGAMTMDNLNILFAELQRNWPEYEPVSYFEYKNKKLSLEASSVS